MEDESWQSNLESWRERRRAALKALSVDLQKSETPPPPSARYVTTNGLNAPENVTTKQSLQQRILNESEMAVNETLGHQKEVVTNAKSQIYQSSASPDSTMARPNGNFIVAFEKRPLPTRLRLTYHPDCVNAANMGLTVAALGDSDGPPFVVRSVTKDSMADRGGLEAGDELFSVDNLCCTFTADRPIIISNLTKLHQMLQRLAAKQRPVEVKVFRGRDKEKGPICSASETQPASIEDKKDLQNAASLEETKGQKLKHAPSMDNGITLVELEKAQPLKHAQQFASTIEAVGEDYTDCYASHPPKVAMATSATTYTNGVDTIRAVEHPAAVGFPEVVIACENGRISRYSSSPPPPTSSDSPVRTPAETPTSICELPPPPSPGFSSALGMETSQPPVPLPLTPSPPPPPPSTSPLEQEKVSQGSEVQISYSETESSPHEQPVEEPLRPKPKYRESFLSSLKSCSYTIDANSGALIEPPSKSKEALDFGRSAVGKDYSGSSQKYATLPNPKRNNMQDVLMTDCKYTTQSEVQYDSDVNSLQDENLTYPSRVETYEVESDVDMIGDVKVLNSPIQENQLQVMRCHEPRVKPKYEILQSIESKGRMDISPSSSKNHIVTICPQPHVLVAQTVAMETPWVAKETPESSHPVIHPVIRKYDKVPSNGVLFSGEVEQETHSEKKTFSESKLTAREPSPGRHSFPSNRPARVNVIGTWYTCAGCNQQLGTSDLMIIEQLSLFYHLSCFTCARCGIQLSDGQNETSVRIRNGLVYCYICYHRVSKSLSRDKNIGEEKRPRSLNEERDRHSSLARTPAKVGPLVNSSAFYHTRSLTNAPRR